MRISLNTQPPSFDRIAPWALQALHITRERLISVSLVTLVYFALVDMTIIATQSLLPDSLHALLLPLLFTTASVLLFGLYLVVMHEIAKSVENDACVSWSGVKTGLRRSTSSILLVSIVGGCAWAILEVVFRKAGASAPEQQNEIIHYTFSLLLAPGLLFSTIWVGTTSIMGQWSLPTLLSLTDDGEGMEAMSTSFEGYRHYLIPTLFLSLFWVVATVFVMGSLPGIVPVLAPFTAIMAMVMYTSSRDMYDVSKRTLAVNA